MALFKRIKQFYYKATSADTIIAQKESISRLQKMLEASYLEQDKAYEAGIHQGRVEGSIAVISQMEKEKREVLRDNGALRRYFKEMD